MIRRSLPKDEPFILNVNITRVKALRACHSRFTGFALLLTVNGGSISQSTAPSPAIRFIDSRLRLAHCHPPWSDEAKFDEIKSILAIVIPRIF
ncbi:hypothetical protein KML24004_22090 [Alistipes indistinctus]